MVTKSLHSFSILFITAVVSILAFTNFNDAIASDLGTLQVRASDPAPGTDGAEFTTFGNPLINHSGQYSFVAGLAYGVGDYTNGTALGIWSTGSGSLQLVMRLGFPAPGTPDGVVFDDFIPGNGQRIKFNDLGQTLYNMLVKPEGGASPTPHGIWRDQDLVVREGDQAPGFAEGVRIDSASGSQFAFASLNDNGAVLFRSAVLPCAENGGCGIDYQNNQVLWKWNGPGTLQKVLQKGEEPPGVPSGGYGYFQAPRLNNNDQIALTIRLINGTVWGGTHCHNNEGVFSDGSGLFELIAREGDTAPGTATGTFFGDGECKSGGTFDDVEFNNNGKVAIRARLTGPEVDDSNDSGLWSNVNGALELVVQEGSNAPATPAGVVFDDILTTSGGQLLNDANQLLLFGYRLRQGSGGVDAGNDSGIWLGPPDNLALIVREGDQVADLDEGVLFYGFQTLCGLNTSGAFSFQASVAGPGIDHLNKNGLFAYDPDSGAIHLIARSGDPFEPTPGEVHTLSRTSCGNSIVREISAGGNGQQVFMDESGRTMVMAVSRSTSDWFVFMTPGFNDEPIADAGADQSVRPGDVVYLDASGSSDPDNDLPLTFDWEFQAKPAGSSSALSDPSAASPNFLADILGDYELTLIVTDSKGLQSAPDTVVISTFNTAPVAEAGDDQALVQLGVPAQLDGTRSYDDDGDDFVYAWTLTPPAGSSTVLDDSTSPTPSFIPDVQGEYLAELVVTDVFFASSEPDQVTLSFDNIKPIADAGNNQNVDIGDLVTLDGTASSDANNDPLSFHWVFITKPAGSTSVLNDPSAAVTEFVADEAGSYVVSLVVNDGFVDSDPSNITILATTTTGAIVASLRDTIDAINSVPDDALKNGNMADALTNKIIAVLDLVDQGRLVEARDKLLHDVLAKSDGCAAAGTPDRNDWVTTCEAQTSIHGLVMDTITLIESVL